jgi:hypothetical protein
LSSRSSSSWLELYSWEFIVNVWWRSILLSWSCFLEFALWVWCCHQLVTHQWVQMRQFSP